MNDTVVRNLDLRPDTRVSFDDGRGGRLTGRIVRVWGRRAINITIKAGDGRTFVRDLSRVNAADSQLPAYDPDNPALSILLLIADMRQRLTRISGQLGSRTRRGAR